MRRRIGLMAFVDVFLLLLITTLALINPPQEDGKITPRSEAMLTMEWSDKQRSDIDIWVRAPDGTKVYFAKKDGTHTILHRDDLGYANDTFRDRLGQQVEIAQNIEVVDLVKLIDGEYIVSAHSFSYRDKEPVDVEIRLINIDPFYTAAKETHTFTTGNQEITYFTFIVKDSKILKVNTDTTVRIVNRR